MPYCPKCGASLRAQPPADWREQWRESQREWRDRRRELREQREQARERHYEEKWEETEKHERGIIGPLVGGVILIFLGLLFYYSITGTLRGEVLLASFLIVIGLIVIATAVYEATIAMRRHPQT